MTGLGAFLNTSIGKKLLMAFTGICFCLFLLIHLAGNLTLFGGPDTFNAYVNHLHALGPLITAAEWVLLTLAIIHVTAGMTLFYQNWAARPVAYAVKKSSGGSTIGSRTMPYTGILLFMFLILHLTGFRFVDHENQTVYQIVAGAFARPVNVILYTIAVIMIFFHVRHGFWSAFQTIGANHPRYMQWLKLTGQAFSILIAVGFGLIPLYMALKV